MIVPVAILVRLEELHVLCASVDIQQLARSQLALISILESGDAVDHLSKGDLLINDLLTNGWGPHSEAVAIGTGTGWNWNTRDATEAHARE